MPTTTDVYGIVKPTSGAEPANGYGALTDLADSVEAALVTAPTFTNVTYNGSWTDFGSPYEEVSYTLSVQGIVRLRGVAKHATTSTTGTVFTLPSGYRPAKTRRLYLGANNGVALVHIDSAGVVSVQSYLSSGTAAALSFDQVAFDISA